VVYYEFQCIIHIFTPFVQDLSANRPSGRLVVCSKALEPSQNSGLDDPILTRREKSLPFKLFSKSSVTPMSDLRHTGGVFVTEGRTDSMSSAPSEQPPPFEDSCDLISILNFEDRCGDAIPAFTEPATLTAMYRLAIEPSMLAKPSEKELAIYGDDESSRRQAETLLENRRLSFIDQIKVARERYLSRRTTQQRAASASPESGEPDYEAQQREAMLRIERMQKKEIEQIILTELKRERDQRKADELRQAQEERQRKLALEIQEKQQADAERRHRKDQVLMQRVAEKQAEMENLRKKQDEATYRTQQLLEQKRAEEQKRLSDADKERQLKAQKQRELAERQRQEETRRIVARLKSQEQREAYMQQRRIEQLDILRQRNAVKASEIRERFALSQEKAKRKVQEQIDQLARREVQSQLRIEKMVAERDQMSQRQHAKTAAQVERHHTAAESLKMQREQRLAELANRNSDYEQRRQLILNEKAEKLRANSVAHEAKTVKIAEQKQKQEQDQEQKNNETKKKWQREEELVEEAKARNQKQLQNQVNLQNLRDNLQRENASRMAKIRQIEIEEKQQESLERQRRAQKFVDSQTELAWKKRDEKTRLDFKKAAILSEFREELKRGGKIDVNELSRRYDLNIDELRRRVEEGDRPVPISAQMAAD
jgi:hypothetical protein